MTSSNEDIFRITGNLCGEFTGPRWIPTQRPVTRSFVVFFDLRLNKGLSKQSWGWWFETLSRPLWCHCNDSYEHARVLLSPVITRVSEVILFSPCVFVCLSRCLSGRFNYEGLVPHKQYFAGTLLVMSSCASYVSRTHDVIDDVTRSQSRSNLKVIYLRQYLS